MAVSNLVSASGGLAVARFPIAPNAPFNIPAGLTLQYTVTSTTTFTAGQLPAQVWAVVIAGGGSGGGSSASANAGGGGGGGVKIGWVDIPSAGITATIGAGGAARTAGQTGQKGGDTSFGSVLVNGGGGGCNSGSAVLDTGNAMPLGEGLPGYGGSASGTWFPNSSAFAVYSNGAPFASNPGSFMVGGGSTTLNSVGNALNRGSANNYLGGGAGGTNFGGSSTGGSGFTAGGGAASSSGGGSSRNGGVSSTFTGGAPGGSGAGGGAGFLANGTAGASATNSGGAGGSGGGGGGAGGITSGATTSGAGGNGCVLIYF